MTLIEKLILNYMEDKMTGDEQAIILIIYFALYISGIVEFFNRGFEEF